MNLPETAGMLVLWLAFLLGLGGSLHCVGMCGGLVTSISQGKQKEIWAYHLGRLSGYSLLGISVGLLGGTALRLMTPYFTQVGSLLIGLLFVFLAVKVWFKNKTESTLAKWLEKKWLRFLTGKKRGSFSVGFASVLLPCGLLYGAVFSLLSFQDKTLGMLALVAFWLGTLPAMTFAPQLIRKILRPLQQKKPLLPSLFFLCLGVLTLVYRFDPYLLLQQHTCH